MENKNNVKFYWHLLKKEYTFLLNIPKAKGIIKKIIRLENRPGIKIVFFNRIINLVKIINKKIFISYPLYIVMRWLYKRMMIKYGIFLPIELKFGHGLSITHYGGIIINLNSLIGNNVTIMHGVTIGNKVPFSVKAPKIADNVFIGANAIIIGDLNIGENSVIGAGSVVTKDVAPNTIVAGNPACLIKQIDKNQ